MNEKPYFQHTKKIKKVGEKKEWLTKMPKKWEKVGEEDYFTPRKTENTPKSLLAHFLVSRPSKKRWITGLWKIGRGCIIWAVE